MPYQRSQNITAKRTKLSRVDGPARRACINCRQRKIRCDIVDKGVPCTNCSTHNRSGCRMCPNKKDARESLNRPAVLAPLRPRESTGSPAVPSPLTTQPASTGREDGEQDLGAHLLNRNDKTGVELGHRTRSHFIGSEVSNCHYLVRQSSSEPGFDKVFHFSNGQLGPSESWYEEHNIPEDILKRPDKLLETRLIRAYFDLINRGWPIVDEELFMSQYYGQDRTNPLCLTLLNAILLVGAHALASQDETMVSLLPVFFRKAKYLALSDSWHDRLVYIQVPLLLTWYSDANAWHWIGIATRTAMAMGIHRDASHSSMLPVYKRTYTRLWWVLFQFDTISATSAGRPQVINLADSDVPDLQYADLEGIPGAEINFIIHHIKLCKVISQTIRVGWAPRASMETRLEAIKRADESLGDLMLEIPARLQPKLSGLDIWQSLLHLTHHNFILLLHRPAPHADAKDQSTEAHEDAILCREATVAIASVFEVLLSQRMISSLWLYSNHVLFTATIYILNQISTSKPLLAAKPRQILDIFLATLRELAKYWTYAKGLLQVLEQRASKIKDERAGRTPTKPQYGASSGQTDRQHDQQPGPHLNVPVEALYYGQPSECSSRWSSRDSQTSNVDLSDLGSNTHPAAGDFNMSMGFLGSTQDPLLDDLFMIDTSAIDLFFYENAR
ncbi:cutinase transcription factor 1 beta [Fusarium beomiforme]|uniref:Cutinase transcription factor 1 beta n=1 Tax=Fusarium beomiforme TaxID=44412 RepID=A0A9P5DXK9_9HYPO|nr:cutinase transcription factor 1 beta [Fusarium beomiforme]